MVTKVKGVQRIPIDIEITSTELLNGVMSDSGIKYYDLLTIMHDKILHEFNLTIDAYISDNMWCINGRNNITDTIRQATKYEIEVMKAFNTFKHHIIEARMKS